jgi:GMP synthase-like glutamine amidotransferase
MRLLAIVHERDAGPGVFLDVIRAAGAQLDHWEVTKEPSPPREPREYDAVLSFGGAMHPDQDDEHAWLGPEKAFLAELIADEVPVLGVCLGAQLLAEAAGAATRQAPEPEIGFHTVRVVDAALQDPLIGPLAPTFEALEWHHYEFLLPTGATALARSKGCLQAFRVGASAWGVQFHAEVTRRDFESWIDEHRAHDDPLHERLPELEQEMRAGIDAWNELGRALCARFLEQVAA